MPTLLEMTSLAPIFVCGNYRTVKVKVCSYQENYVYIMVKVREIP